MSARRTKRFKYILIILEIYLFIILLKHFEVTHFA